MKWSTANKKADDYTQNHDIYVGTHVGTLKKLHVQKEENPFYQKNLENQQNEINKDSYITTLDFGTDNSEILIGRANKYVQVHSVRTESLTTSSLELIASPVVGLARYESFLIAGFGSGQIQKVQSPESLVLSAGSHMSRLRQCSVLKKLIATGGKERQNNLKVFDMEVGKQIFTSKNLPNDNLQLEVPVWDSDIGFIDTNTLVTCSRYGYIRVYDIRKQRRPVQYYVNDKQMSFTTLVARDNNIYTGTNMGALKAFDMRHLKNFVHTYKGFTGSISDLYLDNTGKYLASSSLDRYVRVHNTETCVLQYQCYVKSKATQILIRESDEKQEQHCNSQEFVDMSSIDKEYEEMFENMETVSDNIDEDNSNDDDGSEDAETCDQTESISKQIRKRKISITDKNLKRKKNLRK